MTKPKKATKKQIREAKKELIKILKKRYPYLDIDIDLVDLTDDKITIIKSISKLHDTEFKEK